MLKILWFTIHNEKVVQILKSPIIKWCKIVNVFENIKVNQTTWYENNHMGINNSELIKAHRN